MKDTLEPTLTPDGRMAKIQATLAIRDVAVVETAQKVAAE